MPTSLPPCVFTHVRVNRDEKSFISERVKVLLKVTEQFETLKCLIYLYFPNEVSLYHVNTSRRMAQSC